jgi:hypothetical protein
MTEIGTPFGFVNPARHDNPPFSRTLSLRTRVSQRRTTTSFSRFLRLPAELRLEITRLCIQDARQRRMKWFATQGSPLVLQSRRGVLRVQLQSKQPPSLAPLACVSMEWQDEIEKQLFRFLHLHVVPDSDLASFPTSSTFRPLSLDQDADTWLRYGLTHTESIQRTDDVAPKLPCFITLEAVMSAF